MFVSVLRLSLAALLILCLGAGSASADGDDRVVITGGTVVSTGPVAGDVIGSDGPVVVAGRVTGDVVAISGPIRITGRVDGDVVAVSDRAVLARTAHVGGDLRYGDERPLVAQGAQVGGSIENEDWADTISSPGWGIASWIGWWLAASVSTLLAGVVLLLIAPRMLVAAEHAAQHRLWASLGWGVLVAIALPVAAVLALVTLVGIPFGLALLLALVPVLLVAYVTGAWIVGRRIVKEPGSPWLALLAGWGALRVLALIPVLGFLVGLAATAIGLGALGVAIGRARGPRATPAPAAD